MPARASSSTSTPPPPSPAPPTPASPVGSVTPSPSPPPAIPPRASPRRAVCPVTVTNTGTQPWSAGGSNPVHLGIHFGSIGGGFPGSQPWSTDQRVILPSDVAPGQSVTLTPSVSVPTTAGSYTLEYQMVQEGV